jgi:serine/threonine protein kinase
MDVTAELTFTPDRQIGGPQGRNSTVWIARDHQLDAEIVVKQVDLSKCPSPTEYFAEARRLYFARHPNVVDVKYACRTATHIWLAMPHYTAGSLHTLLEQRFLTVREVVKLGLDFLAGLHHVHVKRLVHLDVKPTNILIGPNFTAALADFGVSQHLDPHGLAPTGLMYDQHLPPEAMTVSLVGPHSDIYQAGLTLYRMSNGLAHFDRQIPAAPSALESAIVKGRFPERSSFLPHIPHSLRRVIRTALEVNPTARYSTVLELLNNLAGVTDHLDWQYTEDPASGARRWTCPRGTHDQHLEVVGSGGAWDGTFTRRNRASGKVTRVAAHCATGMVQSDVDGWVRQVLASA